MQQEIDQFLTPEAADTTAEIDIAPEPIVYPQNSFLTESDFLAVTGVIKPLGFRIGVPMDMSAANALIEDLAPLLAAAKSRYVTGNDKQAVVLVAGNFSDRDEAQKALRDLQPQLKDRLQIIYLPDCVVANQADDEGFICAPPPPDEPPSEGAPAA